jgi:hypothetical protein
MSDSGSLIGGGLTASGRHNLFVASSMNEQRAIIGRGNPVSYDVNATVALPTQLRSRDRP